MPNHPSIRKPKVPANLRKLVSESIDAQGRALETLAKGQVRALLPVLETARRELAFELKVWMDDQSKRPAGFEERWTTQQKRNALVHVNRAIAQFSEPIKSAMGRSLSSAAEQATPMAIKTLEIDLARFEGLFSGSINAPSIDLAAIVAKGDRTLMARHRNSAARYSGAIGDDIRRQIAIGMVKGETLNETMARLSRHRGPRGRVLVESATPATSPQEERAVEAVEQLREEWRAGTGADRTGERSRLEAAELHLADIIRKEGIRRQKARFVSPGDMVEDISEGLFRKYNYWSERLVRTECLPGDQSVSGAAITSAHRRWFEGPMIEIITKSGRKVSGTTNHPMLTTRGWVGAGSVSETDYLVCYTGEESPGPSGDEDIATGPSTISEIFDSLSTVGVGERRRTTTPDFHGDGVSNGHVDIFSTDGVLCYGRFATIGKPAIELSFPEADFHSSGFCPRCRRLLPVNESPCLCGAPETDACRDDSFLHKGFSPSDTPPDRIAGLSRQVPRRETVGVDGCVCPGMVSGGVEDGSGVGETPRNFLRPENLAHPSEANAKARSNPRNAEAGEIEADRVVSVTVRVFCGHVFNLSTECGYFAIDGAYTGNTMHAYNQSHNDGLIEVAQDDEDMKKRWDASMDRRVCIVCRDLDEEVVGVDDAFSSGDQHPPAHPNCRCVLVPWKDRWGELPDANPPE